MHLILTGATGLVGSAVLDAMIKTKDISKITLISRRPVPMAEDAGQPDRIKTIIHEDFTSYPPSLLDQVADATGCVWALGISQTQVSKEYVHPSRPFFHRVEPRLDPSVRGPEGETSAGRTDIADREYVKITKDYALAAAQAFQTLPSAPELKDAPFRFVFVSGHGATHSPGPFTTLFGRFKGETELLLAALRRKNPRFEVDTVRPAGVDWKGHRGIAPYLRQGALKETMMALMRPVFTGVGGGLLSPTEPLGVFLAECAMGKWAGKLEGAGIEEVGDTGSKVVNNTAFRRLARLD